MANIFQAIYDFFASIVELIGSTLSTIFDILKSAAEGILNLFLGIINIFEGVLKGAIDVVGGLGKFIVGESAIMFLAWKEVNRVKAILSSSRSSASLCSHSSAIKHSKESQ
jgi:phage-related protein